jgi:hypothetical protein
MVAFTGNDPNTVQRYITKKFLALDGALFCAGRDTGAPYDLGAECNDLVDNDPGRFFDNKMVVIEQGDNRIGGFLNTDDMVRVDVKGLSVHTGKKNHGRTGVTARFMWYYL